MINILYLYDQVRVRRNPVGEACIASLDVKNGTAIDEHLGVSSHVLLSRKGGSGGEAT